LLCGCQGVNGGGWAHYVGQEKVRPLAGFQTLAFAMDWQRPTRHMTGTSFFYLHSDQWRYESFGADELASPLGRGLFTGRAFADTDGLRYLTVHQRRQALTLTALPPGTGR
jgi:nitrate reductase alpha subunit